MTSSLRTRWLVLLIVGQMLYTAGASLTSGSFFIYYIRQWTSAGSTIAWFLILPELVHLTAFSATYLIRRFRSAKRVWLVAAIIGQTLAVGWAAVGFVDTEAQHAPIVVPILFGVLALSECSRAISYVAFITWLTELWGKPRLGQLFGWRQSGIVAVSMILPPIAAYFREWLASGQHTSQVSAYATIFVLANLAIYLGIAVMAVIPSSTPSTTVPVKNSTTTESKRTASDKSQSFLKTVSKLFADRATRRVMFTSLHLAAAQGLTQSVFFKYEIDVLDVPLTTKTSLLSLMYAIQLPLAVATGFVLDRFDNRQIYAVGLAAVAIAMPFLLLAKFDSRWLIGTYACWGAFAIVNVAGRSTLLRLVEPVDIAAATTTFRFGAGLLAAISGLIGGYWIDAALQGRYFITLLGPFWTIILVSAIGRLTAPLWLLGWNDDRTTPTSLPKPNH